METAGDLAAGFAAGAAEVAAAEVALLAFKYSRECMDPSLSPSAHHRYESGANLPEFVVVLPVGLPSLIKPLPKSRMLSQRVIIRLI